MKIKKNQFSARNPNPVVRADKDGTVLYSNKTGEILLTEWDARVGEKLPSRIRNLVQRVISGNSPEKIEVKVGKIVYLTVFHPLSEEKCVCISGFDISDRKKLEENVQESEVQEMADVELAEIINVNEIQFLMEDFYKLVHMPIGLNDLKGNVLVGAGWQDICTKFHWVHPEACKHCIGSDTKLSADVLLGKTKLYKCKNNMWDITTPITVGSRHVGYIFSGQFFFDDEPLDCELFRSQARKYGFDEEEYMAALEKVPRLRRKAVETGMSFFLKFANLLSQLSYSNIKLAQSLVEHDALVNVLKEREKRERIRSDELEVLLDAVPAAVLITHDPRALKMTGNRLSYDWIRLPEGTNLSKAVPESERYETPKMFKNGVEIQLADMPARLSASGKELHDYEFDFVYPDGTIRHLLGNARPLYDEQGNSHGSVSAFIDITERKKAEEALKRAHDSLEEKIKERTAELETAFNSLKKSQGILAEAQKIARIGSWEWDVASDKAYWSQEMYRIFGRDPQEGAPAYNELLNYIEPEDRDYVVNAFMEGPRREPYFIEFRIILTTGEERTVHMQSETIFEEDNPVLMKGTVQDITERTMSEEKIRNLANIVESSCDAIGTISPEGIITSWNKGAEQVYGYSAEEIKGKHVAFVAPVHLRDETKELSERIKQGESINNYETTQLRKDGKIINVSITLSPVFDSRGKMTASSFISRDITESKAVEEKNSMLAGVVESSSDAIGILSLDGIITSWNKGAEQVYGYSAKEVLGKSVSTMALPHLEKETIKLVEKIKRGEKIHNYETLRLRKDGKTINVSLTLSPVFDMHGKLTAISVISRDITESKAVEEKLRESEKKYRNIVETANEGIIIIDKESTITFTNNRIADMLGYARREGIGRPLWDFLSEESKDIVKLNLKNRLLGIEDSYELKLIKKDGSILWTVVNAKPLFDKDDKYVGSMSMLTDITRRKEAEQTIANFEITREKEIHHRIKNNLQIVSSLLDLQAYKFKGRNDINDSEVIDAFRESQNRVISMALIHEELYKGGLETINFSEYIEKLSDNLLSTYKLGNTDIRLNRDLEEDHFLDMDTAIPLGTIINELVSNSFKYAFPDRDRGEIRIKLHREEEGDFINLSEESECEGPKSTNLILSVSDNGVGIPKNLDIENLDSLGLHLVTSLVEQLDGELEIKRNNGTEFAIRFIAKEKNKKESAPVPNKHSESPKFLH